VEHNNWKNKFDNEQNAFTPSDNVWNSIDQTITKKRRKKRAVIFLLSIAIGNIFTSVINFINEKDDGSIILSGANYFLFFSILMLVVTILFIPFTKNFLKEKILLQD